MHDDLDTPNCPVHLTPMQVAGTVEDPDWWCPDCALAASNDGKVVRSFTGR